jgi:hypothetical protein
MAPTETPDETRIKHCCALCGAVMTVHTHRSWDEIKACLMKNPVICSNCKEAR